jgi:fructose/tagatose bisphosphate aldolase
MIWRKSVDLLKELKHVAQPLGDAIRIDAGPEITILEASTIAEQIEHVVHTATLAEEPHRSLACWLIRACAVKLGVIPASIHDLYAARSRGEIRNDFTVPAINLRAIPFYAARSVFKAALKYRAKAMIFEIARSEMGYTAQRPMEYTASVLGAALAVGYEGPVFIQGDHFQVSASRYAKDPKTEIDAIRNISKDSILGGFYNIDIDTSTLVDLSKPTIHEQQKVNYALCAEFSSYIRNLEPEGVTISLGGEIGEVGGHNSTEEELRAFMDGYDESLATLHPGAVGLSKISIQTGTSHGGVVLPDGSIAAVKVDFNTLDQLGTIAKEYGMGGAVQHGASTLPESAFSRFPEVGTLEVHLATNFQNILYDRLPAQLREEIYTFLRENHSDERKPDQTDEQFYYKTRKRAIGRFKPQLWDLSVDVRDEIEASWERQFDLLFDSLNVAGTAAEVEAFIQAKPIIPPVESYLGEVDSDEDVSDLAD